MSRSSLYALAAGALLALSTLTPLNAQRIEPTRSFVFNVDFSRYLYTPEATYLEFSFAVYPSLVTLEKDGDRYKGAVLLHIRARNVNTGQNAVDVRSMLPIVVPDTSGPAYRQTLVARTGYAVPHGTYELMIAAADTTQLLRTDTLRYAYELSAFGPGVQTSDIELCSNIVNSKDSSNMFFKNGLEVVPNPTQVFGVPNYPVLFYYLEFYNLRQDEPLKVSAIIADMSGTVIRQSTKDRTYATSNSVDAGMMNVSSIQSGKYVLQVSIQDAAGAEIVSRQKQFFIYNPHVAVERPDARQSLMGPLSGLTEEELDEEFDNAQYVATQRDKETYRQLQTVDAKRQFLAEFWSAVQAGKPGMVAISREEYLRRVTVASRRYRAFTRPGWKTDRGRVYILYAEPDQVDRIPSSDYAKPHEVWYYYQIENGVQFVFIDRTGFGDYVLVHSTKRGELYDENWQRLLQ